MNIFVALSTNSCEIFGRVITQSIPRANMVDLKIFHTSAPLASPAISFQNFTAKLSISALYVKDIISIVQVGSKMFGGGTQ